MCSLAVILRASPRYPFIAAANRDESRLRASRVPFLWETSHADTRGSAPRILAGRDETRGGTWMGVNELGLFAAVTNLWGQGAPDSRRASRGQLVLRVLSTRGVDGAAAALAREDPAATNPFLIVCADRGGAGFWTSSVHAFRPGELAPGMHAFGNLLPGDPAHMKAAGALRRIGEGWEARAGDEPEAVVAALAAPLAEHVDGGDPKASVCVHTDGEYGTVSSSILLAGTDARSCRFLHAAGPPCVTPYEDLTSLLNELWKAH
jgi:uncharacterized protein with NRDE domain